MTFCITTDAPMYWDSSSVSVSEGIDCDSRLKIYRNLTSTEDDTMSQQTVDVVIIGGMCDVPDLNFGLYFWSRT